MIEAYNLKKVYRTQRKPPGLLAAVKMLLSDNAQEYCLALDNINLGIDEGEVVGVLGPNGAGKTTLLKLLSGLLYPTSGTAEIYGHIPWHRDDAFKRKVTMVMGQKNQLMWDISAMDSFLWLKEIYEIPKPAFDETVEELSGILDVKQQLNVQLRRLSFGQRMKMELIAAMLHTPKIAFLDEPTIGLDVLAQQNIHSFIKQYNKRHNATILLTSHNLIDIEKLCRRVVVIMKGNIAFDGQLEDLIRQHCPYKQILVKLASGGLEIREEFGELEVLSREGNNYCLKVNRAKCREVASMLWGSYDVEDLSMLEPSANEVIQDMFSTQKTG